MVAAVDCTGHGVPGAFMSIVGNDQLNYAINVKGARTPAEILDSLNEGVGNTLRQHEGTVKDGMDLALCTIDSKSKKLFFAGAKNPLYHIRNGELTVYKGDKFPIGVYVDSVETKFNNHEVSINKGDTIYIFSDGYADQFGGPRNRKFMYKNFKEYLLSIQNMGMEEQKAALLAKLKDWMGKNQQVDDILVIGIKF
jgi:serine phosphatase RsbU (regulator of sigma subunit)